MHDSILFAILAGLGGMIGWGGADFFAKKTVDEIGPIKSLVWAHCFGTLLLLLFVLVQHIGFGQMLELPASGSVWLGLAFFGSLQMIVYWLAYQGFEKGLLGVLNPVFASYSGLVVLLSIVFLGEKAGIVLILALVAIFVGNMLLNVDLESLRSKRLKISPGLKEVAAAAVLAAVWTLGWGRFIADKQPTTFALLMYAFMTVAAIILSLLMKVSLRGIPRSLWKFLFLMGVGETVAYLAISWGFSANPHTSVIALVSGTFSVPTVILAYVFLKERFTKLQMSAMVIIVSGIVLISIT